MFIAFKHFFVGSILMILVFASCNTVPKTPADYVNPIIGTGGHGHTYPGATTPFGMVQLSPDTRKDSWDGCSGYHYSDDFILGFSHTHLSGTGVGDYGDIRFVPTIGNVQFKPGSSQNPNSGYGSKFNHDNENASPGYYSVELDNNIDVELTATPRVGFHRYIFPNTSDNHILIDLIESIVSEKIIDAELKIISNHEVLGYRRTKGWASNQRVYFYASFSIPFSSFGIYKNGIYNRSMTRAKSDSLIAVLNFDFDNNKPLLVKVGISAVGYDGAMHNCNSEIPNWDFSKVKNDANTLWNKELSKINVLNNDNEDNKTIFYTALYHTMLAPNLYSDVDGSYRNHSDGISKDDSFNMYTVFSLWDTFRTLHPLFTIIEREKTNNFINSMLDMYKNDSLLPVWELAANETNCMIGYHAASVITDAWIKGIRGFDAHLALNAMVVTAESNKFGLQYFNTKGYIPADKEGESVSKTLEYAYDDWCIARLADGLHDTAIYNKFIKRAQYYKNIYDNKTGFFRGKSNGCFITPFDPTQVNFMLTEANTWQYNFFVPQDINTHINLLGGDEKYEAKLDTLTTTSNKLSGREQSDITGLIGQYAHGNEPSHNMAYLYNYVGKPYKTQKLVHQILTQLYTNSPNGLSGNEDCGQMSAWYVMSAMGFYPVTPGSNTYVIGTPLFNNITLNLENNKTLSIKAIRNSDNDTFVQSISYNGTNYSKSYIDDKMIMNGGQLVFTMGDKPNHNFGNAVADRPKQIIKDNIIVPVPYFSSKSKTFIKSTNIAIDDINKEAKIMVSDINNDFTQYSKVIYIDTTTTFTAFAEYGGNTSKPEKSTFISIPKGRKITILSPYSNQYTAGGGDALINTIRGGFNFKTGNWQGYYGNDVDVIVDLGSVTDISKIGIGFLQDENSWIFMPLSVTIKGSVDGNNYKIIGIKKNKISPHKSGAIIKDFIINDINQQIRYIKITAKNRKLCPDWHKGAGKPAWIFTDEIWVE